MKIATLSFDDGGPDDLPVLALLRKRGLTGTFYLVLNRISTMDPQDYAGFEVASHTLTHPRMVDCSPEDRKREVSESRERLAALFGRKPDGIAWPGGGFHPQCAADAHDAGYAYGRGFYVTPGDPRRIGAPWNRGITLKFYHDCWTPNADVAHLVAHPAAMDLGAFDATLQRMADQGYSFVTNAEFYSVPQSR